MSQCRDKPTIELFMFSLHQEFPEGVSHESFIDRKVTTRDMLSATGDPLRAQEVMDQTMAQPSGTVDWPGKWLHAKWITNHTKAITGLADPYETDPMTQALSRVEDFGGVIYDPVSDKVFKVNEPGLELFQKLQQASRNPKKANAFKSPDFAKQDVVEFMAFLKGAGLWKH